MIFFQLMVGALAGTIGAIFNRARGNDIVGTQVGRIVFWFLPVAAFSYYMVPDWQFALAMGTAAWASQLIAHSNFQDAGRWVRPGRTTADFEWHTPPFFPTYTIDDPMWKRELVDTVHGAWTGLLRGMLYLVVFWWFKTLPLDVMALFLLGLIVLTPISYSIGWRIDLGRLAEKLHARKGIEMGEIVTGFAFLILLYYSLLFVNV